MVIFKGKSFILREFCFFNIWILLRIDEVIDVWSKPTLYAKADKKSEDEEEEEEEERMYFVVLLTCNDLYVIFMHSKQHFRSRWAIGGAVSVFSSA